MKKGSYSKVFNPHVIISASLFLIHVVAVTQDQKLVTLKTFCLRIDELYK